MMEEPVRQHEVVQQIVGLLEPESSVEGVFLSGSLVNEDEDPFSDVDLGIVSGDSAEALAEAYALRHRLLSAVGRAVTWIERGWDHCQLIAALYGRSQFPPIGLQVDLVFSQVQHVTEQMPYAAYRVLLDKSGRLTQELDTLGLVRPKAEIEQELEHHLRSYLFCLHDASKAWERGDPFALYSQLDEMRKILFFAAAIRRGGVVYGSKRAYRYLSTAERQIVQDSCAQPTRETIVRLTDLCLLCLDKLRPVLQIDESIRRFHESVRELL